MRPSSKSLFSGLRPFVRGAGKLTAIGSIIFRYRSMLARRRVRWTL